MFDQKLAIYTVVYKESESEVKKNQNFRALREKSRKTTVKLNLYIFKFDVFNLKVGFVYSTTRP